MIELKGKQYPARFVHHQTARCHISGTGLARAARRVSNDDLAKLVDTSDEWISSRSGIRTRYLVADETTTDLAAEAAKSALEKSGLEPKDIGLILVASFTGDSKMPSVACRVQARLGIANAVAFDLSAACSGFVFAMNTAASLLESGHAQHALVIGAEVLSKTLDWTDRGTCVLFGDGAGAIVLSKNQTSMKQGLQTLLWGAQGEGGEDVDAMLLGLKAGAGSTMKMQGRAVYKFAVGVVPEMLESLMDIAELQADEIDHVVAHQANQRILEAAAHRSGVALEKWFQNLAEFGNTSAASIAIALAEMDEKERLKKGDKLVLLGFGGGLTYGGVYLTWA